MITQKNMFGYDPDQFDEEPSDYASENYPADDLSRDSAEELIPDEDDDLAAEDDDLEDDDLAIDDDDLAGDDLDDDTALADDDFDEEDVEDDDAADTDVDEDDPINDDVTDYPTTQPDALHGSGKPVYINDLPTIDAARPGVTAH